MLRYPGTGVNQFKEMAEKCKDDTGINIQYTALTTDDVIKRAVTQPNLVRHDRFRILVAEEDRAVRQSARHGHQEDQALDKIMTIFTKGAVPDGTKTSASASHRSRSST